MASKNVDRFTLTGRQKGFIPALYLKIGPFMLFYCSPRCKINLLPGYTTAVSKSEKGFSFGEESPLVLLTQLFYWRCLAGLAKIAASVLNPDATTLRPEGSMTPAPRI